jgi:catechol 2,3-dioxygenase-like lactoylglutathione lyase family enzyme
VRLLRAATLTTPDPVAAARQYQEFFGYLHLETGIVSQGLADSWGAPAMAGRGYTVIGPSSGVPVFLRFVESPAVPGFVPLRSFGWGAIELCVQDVQAVHARMQGSPFEIIGPPRALDGDPKIWPMQVQGPDGEIVFLTEIRGDDPGARLPRAACLVDCLFIAVLACADIAATRAWFDDVLGCRGGPDFELAYTTLSRAFGLPVTAKHKIALLGHGEDAFLQLDQYPAGAAARVTRPGELPPGVAMVSFAAPAWGQEAGVGEAGVVYGGGRRKIVRTPEGAVVELIALPPDVGWVSAA